MADYLPQNSGLWSTTTWITAFSNLTAFAGGNVPPTIIDDVYADGKTITIDINPAINSIRTTTTPRTGGLAGGGFYLNNGITLSAASVIPGSSTVLTFLSASPSTCTIVGNISGSVSTAGVHGLLNNSSGIINIFGNALGSSVSNSTGPAVLNNSSGTINMVGNATGGTGTDAESLRNASSGTINLTGTSFGGSGNSSAAGEKGPWGIRNSSSGTINVLGNAIAGSNSYTYGLYNQTTGTISITGNIVSGSAGIGPAGIYAHSTSSGNIFVYSNIINTGPTYANSAPAINLNGLTNLTIFGFVSAANSTVVDHRSTGKTTIYGDSYGGRINASTYGVINNNNSGIVEIYGNVYGGVASSGYGAYNNANGTIFIAGSAFGGGLGSGAGGVMNNSAGTVIVSGSVIGGSNTTAYGALNNSTGTIYISGNAIGGSAGATTGALNVTTGGTIHVAGNAIGGATGASLNNVFASGVQNSNNNTTTGRIFVYGNAVASDFIAGAINWCNGILYVKKAIGSSFGLGSVGVASNPGIANFNQNGLAYVEQVEFGSRGQTPISGPVYILPSNRNTLTGYTTAAGTPVTFYNSLSVSNLLPPASSVRLGTVYNVGNSTGTMAVPSASAVQFGVAVDNTTGTAALQPQDVWGYARLSATQINSLGDRLRNVATTQSVGQQIASFNL